MKLDEARTEFCLIFHSFFGQWSFKKKYFWDLLTFTNYSVFGWGEFLQNFRPSLTYLEWLYFWVAERCILLLEKFSRLMVFKTVNYYLLLQEISRILTISLKNNRCFWVNWYCIAKYFLPLKGLTRANIAQR